MGWSMWAGRSAQSPAERCYPSQQNLAAAEVRARERRAQRLAAALASINQDFVSQSDDTVQLPSFWFESRQVAGTGVRERAVHLRPRSQPRGAWDGTGVIGLRT